MESRTNFSSPDRLVWRIFLAHLLLGPNRLLGMEERDKVTGQTAVAFLLALVQDQVDQIKPERWVDREGGYD